MLGSQQIKNTLKRSKDWNQNRNLRKKQYKMRKDNQAPPRAKVKARDQNQLGNLHQKKLKLQQRLIQIKFITSQ